VTRNNLIAAGLMLIVTIIIIYVAFSEKLGQISTNERTENFLANNVLSRNNGSSYDPQIIAAGQNLYAVWTDNTTGNDDIYFKGIDDVRTYNLSRNNGSSYDPQIIAAGQNLYAVWTDNTTGNDDIYFKRIEDNGHNFSRTYNLSRNNGTSYDSQIIAAGQNLYAVWTDNSTGNDDIYFKRIEDNGNELS